ncbi:MAG: SGNH/GDSL hydrolase family protein [Candidatus Pseudobacter hemicellulosilyticus]|uniref:SGNH/GDSL hydrolase family protein n=1 Tax=Candidatus Pseudobacter hemicellulosilyticus TaxID=3121375 RepID=A0AAJ5WM13_9BACT|nr:MAG: SGNH/GDSL hydrolase family protein [Pseudobacter sp.]
MHPTTYTYLALGDSYTIGEGVPLAQNFPYQAVQLLRRSGHDFHAPEIIAKTGWTTDELMAAMADTVFNGSYDYVSLLIGVNNQYRGRPVQEYAEQFTQLLERAIALAGGRPDHVFVLSIPDWGITPFAEGREREQIRREIDLFNSTNQSIAEFYTVHYIDITPGTREVAAYPDLLTTDQLHYSGKEYKRWAEKLEHDISNTL